MFRSLIEQRSGNNPIQERVLVVSLTNETHNKIKMAGKLLTPLMGKFETSISTDFEKQLVESIELTYKVIF